MIVAKALVVSCVDQDDISTAASKVLKEVADARGFSLSLQPFDVSNDLVKQMTELSNETSI